MIAGFILMTIIALFSTFCFGLVARRDANISKLRFQRDVLYKRFPSGAWMEELQDRRVFTDPLDPVLVDVLAEIKGEER